MAQDDGARVIGLGTVSGAERVARAVASFRTSVPDRGPAGPRLFQPGEIDLLPLLDGVLGAGHLLFFRQHAGTRSALHTHSCDQILIVLGGAGSIHTEEAAHPLRPGYVVFVPAGQKRPRHRAGRDPGVRLPHDFGPRH
ncbi:MAG: hypothetical protein U0531_08255 [Dehalococcoidia bacterium]